MRERDGLKIAMVAAEAVPYVKTGGLADVVGALAPELVRLGHEVAVFLPRYRAVDVQALHLEEACEPLAVSLGSLTRTARLFGRRARKSASYYFIDQEAYFDRDHLYGTRDGDYPDNAERFAFFARAVMEALRVTGFEPDILHAHDWQAALAPVYLKAVYAQDAGFKKTKAVFSIHNLAYQGIFPHAAFQRTGLPDSAFSLNGLEFWGNVNYLKGGLIFSDLITTVSQRYAEEIRTSAFGCGLEGVLASRARDLHGILNGIDTDIWNPANDPFVKPAFDRRRFPAKGAVKADLQSQCSLPRAKDAFVIGMITRLADQKGLDLVEKVLPALLRRNVQIIVLGTGEARYHRLLEQAAAQHPRSLRVFLKFDDPLAHKIYAGADAFLMPSRYEPCGLSQMISLRYGTLPIVRATGGLADTIRDLDEDPQRGNGFVFYDYRDDAFLAAVLRALTLYEERRPVWEASAKRAMSLDFSWRASAGRYVEVYRKLHVPCTVA